MIRLALLTISFFVSVQLWAQSSLLKYDEGFLSALVIKLQIDTNSVTKYTRSMEDSILVLKKNGGFNSELKSIVKVLAVRDFYLGRYSNTILFTKDISTPNADLIKLKNYLLLCSYAHQNDVIKLGDLLRKQNLSTDSEIYHELQMHCLNNNVDLNQITTEYKNYLKKENSKSNKILTTAIIAGVVGFAGGVVATVGLILAAFSGGL